jgi:hypothetical protein
MLRKLIPTVEKFYKLKVNYFTGKTQTGWKFTTPLMKMKSINPIFPAPGFNLEIPSKIV